MSSKAARARPFVIKVGGSLASSPLLARWLQIIEPLTGEPIIVPGGGGFADAVRQAQKDMGFDDLTAHRMALLAMEQYGLALAAQAPRLLLCATPAAIKRAWRLGRIPAWAPAHMLSEAAPVPPSWDATSDSLAAWLARELNAARLLLIKSVDLPDGVAMSLRDLADADLVDPLFPSLAGVSGAEIYLAGPAALETAAAVLAQGGVPGTHIPQA